MNEHQADTNALDDEARELGGLLAAAKLRLPEGAPRELQESFKAYLGPKQFRPYFERKWLSLRLSALKRGMVVDASVTPALLEKVSSSECPVTLEPLSIDGPDEQKPTVDRLVNEVGYRAGNICMLSRRANHAKAEYTFEEVLGIAVKAEAFRGLEAKEWARLASLMYGAWAYAYRQADPLRIPLSTFSDKCLFMSTSQIVQLLLVRHFGIGGPKKEASKVWLRVTRSSGCADELFIQLRDALSAGLREEPRPLDVWTRPAVFDAFVRWYERCEDAILREVQPLLEKHQRRIGDPNAYADWQRNMR